MACRWDHDEIYEVECLLAKGQELWHRQTFSKPTKARTKEIIKTMEDAKLALDKVIATLSADLKGD